MGEMDLIKPYIERTGKVLFGRVNMKPGKPTTFGVIDQSMVFALPGNPVSSFVTANLFLPLALLSLLERSYLYADKQTWPKRVTAHLHPKVIKTDRLRPEYHRCTVYRAPDSRLHAISTGPN